MILTTRNYPSCLSVQYEYSEMALTFNKTWNGLKEGLTLDGSLFKPCLMKYPDLNSWTPWVFDWSTLTQNSDCTSIAGKFPFVQSQLVFSDLEYHPFLDWMHNLVQCMVNHPALLIEPAIIILFDIVNNLANNLDSIISILEKNALISWTSIIDRLQIYFINNCKLLIAIIISVLLLFILMPFFYHVIIDLLIIISNNLGYYFNHWLDHYQSLLQSLKWNVSQYGWDSDTMWYNETVAHDWDTLGILLALPTS